MIANGRSSPHRRSGSSKILTGLALLGFLFFVFNFITSRLTHDINAAQQQSTVTAMSTSQALSLESKGNLPEVLPNDLIYENARTVFVIPEYKLIFFTFPKVACSEWKRMFMRINGNENWCRIRGFDAHDPSNNKISTLSDYPTEIATAMMTSPKWTRAAIVREPKERVLSAFLDKAVKEHYYVKHCCDRIPDEDDKKSCIDNEEDFKSFITMVNKYPKECFDVHWEAQVVKIDSKWWPHIDFVGHQNNLVEDAQTLLKSLSSTRDDVPDRSAWERYGAKGWGNDNELCEERPNAFLVENSSTHKLDTGSHLLEWYTAETEKMVEKYWGVEWEQAKANFPEIKLFPDEE